MRVCLLTPELPPYRVGGIGTYVAALAEELGRRGHAVDVAGCDIHPAERVVSHPWGRSLNLPTEEHPLGSACGRAAEDAVRWMVRHRVPGAWRASPYVACRSLAAAALTVRRFVRRRGHRYDVIEYSNWPGHAAWLPPQRGRGVYVARLSTSSADTGGSDVRVALAMERKAVRKAAVVITHSIAMLRKGQELYGFPTEIGRFVRLGLPDRPTDVPPNDGMLRLVAVGRAEDRKGTDLLVAALARVLPAFPSAAFRFVGPGLPDYLAARPELREAWGKLLAACPGRVEDMGRISDAEREAAVGRAHWLIAPSRFESFGLVAVEAMRVGTPVIYASAGGLAEVGAVCPANVAVEPGDANDLERAIADACRCGPGPALDLRAAARRAFEESFSAAAMANRTLEAYEFALRGGRP